MSRERSYFEHNGMPLHASSNAGHVRQMQEQWLGLFTAHRAQPAEQQQSGISGAVMPEPSDEVAGMNGDAEGGSQTQVNEPTSAPSLLQRAETGATAMLFMPVMQSTNQQQPQFTSVAQPDAAVPFPMGQPSIPVNVRHAEPAHGTEIKAAGGSEGASANLATAGASPPAGASDAAPLPPRVLVQKHITIQTEISSMSMASESAATSWPGGAIMPFVAAMGSPISPTGGACREPSQTLTLSEGFSAAAVLPAAVPVQFAPTPMGAGNIPIGNTRQPAMPQSQPQINTSQQALLDRLNDRSASQQEAGGGRRVHIGNLRITVQRPAVAVAQTPSSAPSAQPQAAAVAGQTLFNPWERHYMAFD